jgi:hypothetical protein
MAQRRADISSAHARAAQWSSRGLGHLYARGREGFLGSRSHPAQNTGGLLRRWRVNARDGQRFDEAIYSLLRHERLAIWTA